jgi:hypothetical protein
VRPFPRFGNINYVTYDATSNYNSLQLQVHRRFAAGLEISGVWTWSKVMSTSDNGAVSPYLNERARYYGLASFDRTHVVNLNWIYDLPKVSRFYHQRALSLPTPRRGIQRPPGPGHLRTQPAPPATGAEVSFLRISP